MNKKNGTKRDDTTLLALVVDRSGSMETIRTDMEGGIRTLLAEQAAEPGTCLVSLAQFDTDYELVFEAAPIEAVIGYQLVPRGGTALLDAIGRTIGGVREAIDHMTPEGRPEHVIFAVVTDGMENSSREWSRDKVMSAVKERSDAGWHFSFLGANQDAIKEGGDMGVAAAASLTYDASGAGVAGAMSSFSASVRRVRSRADASLTYTEAERRAAEKR